MSSPDAVRCAVVYRFKPHGQQSFAQIDAAFRDLKAVYLRVSVTCCDTVITTAAFARTLLASSRTCFHERRCPAQNIWRDRAMLASSPRSLRCGLIRRERQRRATQRRRLHPEPSSQRAFSRHYCQPSAGPIGFRRYALVHSLAPNEFTL